MALRLGIDIDGVLADMDAGLARAGDRLTPAIGRPGSLSAADEQRLWRAVSAHENFWEELSEIEPGSVRRLAELAQASRWDVLFLTQRPSTAGDTPQVQTQRWLARHGFPLPSVFVVNSSRGKIAAALALDVVIDDSRSNCLDVRMDSTARAMLMARRDDTLVVTRAARVGIDVVRSLEDCFERLAVMEQQAPGGTTMASQLKRWFGASIP